MKHLLNDGVHNFYRQLIKWPSARKTAAIWPVDKQYFNKILNLHWCKKKKNLVFASVSLKSSLKIITVSRKEPGAWIYQMLNWEQKNVWLNLSDQSSSTPIIAGTPRYAMITTLYTFTNEYSSVCKSSKHITLISLFRHSYHDRKTFKGRKLIH